MSSLTVLADVILATTNLSEQVKGRQIRKNQRVVTANGFEAVNIVWDRTLREFDFGVVPMPRSSWLQIEAVFEVTEGGAYGFLLEDPKDGSVAIGGQGVVAALSGGGYQLFKRYTEAVSGRYKDRKITRPKASSVVVYVSGAPTTATVDATTGIATLSGSPAANLVTWSGQFYVPVHFLNDQIDWDLVFAGPNRDARVVAGPLVTLQEVRE